VNASQVAFSARADLLPIFTNPISVVVAFAGLTGSMPPRT
jgi:hypothetical protein